MERIQVTVDEVASGDSDDAFDIMLRFNQYSSWWPKSIPIICEEYNDSFIGNKLVIKPYPFAKVGWKIHSYDPGREIIIHYYKGMHTGMGVWTFSEADNEKAVISFEIDILPKNKFYNWIYKIFNVRKSHIKQVKMVINALSKEINQADKNNPSVDAH